METTKQIPILDLSPEIERHWEAFSAAFASVLRSGTFIMGPSVKAFEREAAKYLGVEHAVGVNSGTDALVIGLRAAGVGAGDEVMTTPFTFFATAEAITILGAKAVFVDIEPRTFNIDTTKIAAKITKRTKAIIPVHLFGHPVNMDPVMALAREHGLKIVEDVAQAFGAEIKGRKVGNHGDVGAFSFFPSKNLGSFGDAGLLTTNDAKIAESARMLRAHGSKRKYYNETVGYNSRLDELQAALLRVMLPHIDESNDGRRAAARRYAEVLSSIPGIVVPHEEPGVKHVYHQYTIRVLAGKRDRVQERLTKAGISTMLYYPVPVHRLPIYEAEKISLPVAEAAAQDVLSLPIWPTISSETQLRVAKALADAVKD